MENIRIKKEFWYADKIKSETPLNKQGEIHGVKKYYYQSGNIEMEIPFENDKRHGIAKSYYNNGNIRSETPYEYGEEHGVSKLYYENGNIESETPHRYDDRHGVQKLYREDGSLYKEISYKKDIKDGIQKEYYKDDSIKVETPYSAGNIHGDVKYYSAETKKLETIKKYTYDKLVDVIDCNKKARDFYWYVECEKINNGETKIVCIEKYETLSELNVRMLKLKDYLYSCDFCMVYLVKRDNDENELERIFINCYNRGVVISPEIFEHLKNEVKNKSVQ